MAGTGREYGWMRLLTFRHVAETGFVAFGAAQMAEGCCLEGVGASTTRPASCLGCGHSSSPAIEEELIYLALLRPNCLGRGVQLFRRLPWTGRQGMVCLPVSSDSDPWMRGITTVTASIYGVNAALLPVPNRIMTLVLYQKALSSHELIWFTRGMSPRVRVLLSRSAATHRPAVYLVEYALGHGALSDSPCPRIFFR